MVIHLILVPSSSKHHNIKNIGDIKHGKIKKTDDGCARIRNHEISLRQIFMARLYRHGLGHVSVVKPIQYHGRHLVYDFWCSNLAVILNLNRQRIRDLEVEVF